VHRLALTILALALLAAACGNGSGFGGTTSASTTLSGETTVPTVPTTPPTTLPGETTTTAPPVETTSTTVPLVTTSTTPGVYYEVDTTDFFPDPFPGSSGGAHGSGCVVPDYVTLPDGVWFGFAEAVGGGAIDFDLACFFTGEAAVDAAAEDGEEAFDFYIRNNVAVTYHVSVAVGARVWYISMTSGDVSMPTEIPLASWPNPDSFQDCPSDHCAVWLYVNGGQVTGIVEQYLP
jgi:hypothetical protein